jgi:hypothetical protein
MQVRRSKDLIFESRKERHFLPKENRQFFYYQRFQIISFQERSDTHSYLLLRSLCFNYLDHHLAHMVWLYVKEIQEDAIYFQFLLNQKPQNKRRTHGVCQIIKSYLTASSNWLAMCFLLLDGVTQIALMPQTAGTVSSQMIAPLRIPSETSELLTEQVLFLISLLKLISPNWRVVELCLATSLAVVPSDPPFSELEQTLNAFFIGSACKHPTILWEEINRYTCQSKKQAKNDGHISMLNHTPQRHDPYLNIVLPIKFRKKKIAKWLCNLEIA